nr:hypothetical protein [Tanacetum cinerariifolium]
MMVLMESLASPPSLHSSCRTYFPLLGCTYKEFLACNLKEYDGKGGAIVYTRLLEKMESVQDMSGCRDSQKEALKLSGIDATMCYDAIFGNWIWQFDCKQIMVMVDSLGEDAYKQGRIDDADAEVTFIDETLNDARNKNNKISNSKRWKMTKKQINDDDLEEIDLKWQVAMISTRIKKFHKRTGRKFQFDTRDIVGFDKIKVECFNWHKMGHFARDCRAKWNQDSRRRHGGYNGNKTRDNNRRPAYQDDSKALVTIDGEAVDWSGHIEEDTQNFAMLAYSSSNSGSDNKVQSCFKTSAESYARLKNCMMNKETNLIMLV